MLFDTQTLKDKSHPGISSLQQISFEYLLAKVCLEYVQLNKNKILTVEDFNNRHQIFMINVFMYPFFNAISSGYSKALFNLYGNFYALKPGLVAIDLFHLITRNQNNHIDFTHFRISPTGHLTIQHQPEAESAPVKEKLNSILAELMESIVHADSGAIAFKQIRISSDNGGEQFLYRAINTGIEAIQKQNRLVFDTSPEILLLHASYALKRRYVVNEKTPITYEEVSEVPQRPFYFLRKNLAR